MILVSLKIFFSKKPRNLNDNELIDAYKSSKDLSYLGELFQRKTPMIASLSLKYLKHAEDAEDATYEIFEVIRTDLLKHEVSNINAWLFSVTRNHCYKKLNKAAKNQKISVEGEKSVLSSMENSSDEDLSEKWQKEEQLDLLEEAIEQLKDEQKLCVQLFYLQQKSYQEIADETQLELGKVKSYIQNGKRNLKIYMEAKLSKLE